jgi:serine/threonine-protein kinase
VVAATPGSIDAGVGIGEIFVDKYRVERVLGHGGMGVVALCTHLALNEHVAIKMLRKDVLDDADAVERFMREAQAAVKLKSEYVARVIDVGRSSANVPYMVMEYLDGEDLGQLLEDRRTLGVPWAVEITMQCCEALAEAHSLGIVHRDVKPTNLFVTWRPDGSAIIKVLDFGISKALASNSMVLTQTQSLLGTPAYMSPEQMRSARMVDARTDLWSLGTVMYEMLEGRRPFEAESFSEMCVKVAVDPPGAMTQTPPGLQQIVLRCLEKAPEQRYPSMAELARDLVPFSQDPHQAQVLVERMTRTLRRSQVQPVEWNPASSSGSIRLPSGERLAETAPAPAAPAPLSSPPPVSSPAAGAAPSPAPATAPSPAAADAASPTAETQRAVAPRAEGSEPRLSETLSVSRPRRRSALVIATAVIGAAALGVAISLAHAPAPRGDASAPPPAGQPAPALAPGPGPAAAAPVAAPEAVAPAAAASDPQRTTAAAGAPPPAGPATLPAPSGSPGSNEPPPASAGSTGRLQAAPAQPKPKPPHPAGPQGRELIPGKDCTINPDLFADPHPLPRCPAN